MSVRHFCTYFDHRYLARGLALHQSLAVHAPGSVLWVLCLSDECERMLRAAGLPGVRLLTLAELEAADHELSATRANRSLVEFYFTCSPCLPRHILATQPEVGEITYLDSDLFFYSSPEPLFAEMGAAQVAIIPHRFPPGRAAQMERYGRYNVGWLTFRRGAASQACLDWWRERCIEWCYDRLEGERFADQKYLDQFEALFPSVHVIGNLGANLAPWNLANYRIESPPPRVDGTPLVFFHFHGLKQVGSHLFDTRFDDYKIRLDPAVEHGIYRPYLQRLLEAQAIAAQSARRTATGADNIRNPHGAPGWTGRVRTQLLTIRSALRGNLIRVS